MVPHDSQKLLTIAIPTWNRSEYLKELLDQLVTQISQFQLENQIEIVVSNNNSDDNTEEVINIFRSKHTFINYNKNNTNIGAKSNVIRVLEIASSAFVMLIGDDDRIRENCLPEVLALLKTNLLKGVIIDQHGFKKNKIPSGSVTNTPTLVENYFWLMGNAGHFILRTDDIKKYVDQYGYNFFNECWPQTQLTLLSLENSKGESIVADLNILNTSLHTDVMVYSSFYLWRTCYYELLVTINDLKDKISPEIYKAARVYMKESLMQQTYNILQCGIFVDTPMQRTKTRNHIFKHTNLFSIYERLFLWTIIIALTLPTFISKPFFNIAILLIGGNEGLRKKIDFVRREKSKNQDVSKKNGSIRSLEFEK